MNSADKVSAAADYIRHEAGLAPDRQVEIKTGGIPLSQDKSLACTSDRRQMCDPDHE